MRRGNDRQFFEARVRRLKTAHLERSKAMKMNDPNTFPSAPTSNVGDNTAST